MNGARHYSGATFDDKEACWWMNRGRRKIVWEEWEYSREWGREEEAGCMMHSSVNEIHHHPSDRFVTFSTGATGRPQDHIPRTRKSPRWLRGTLVTHLKCLLNISACFTHRHTHTHTPTITSVVQRQALCFTSFKLHQTKKQWKLKLR